MRFPLLLCAGGLAVTLAGCGLGSGLPSSATSGSSSAASTDSGSSSAGDRHTGRAVLTIHWPQTSAGLGSRASRLIPTATQSVKVTLATSAGVLVTSKVATAPASAATSTMSFDSLTAGVLHVTVAAYPTLDASGTALASGALDVTITSGQVTEAALSLASTIDHLAVSYTAPDILAGETQNVTVTAYDATNNVVLLSPNALAWTSSDATKATVAATSAGGTITGVGAGAATITVTDTESHVTKTFPIQGFTFSVTPAAPSVSVRAAQTFTATVAGLADNSVTYSLVDANGAPVANGGASGSIDAQGNYTAPVTPGTCYVRVTSVGDPARYVTATLHIAAGNGVITIQ